MQDDEGAFDLEPEAEELIHAAIEELDADAVLLLQCRTHQPEHVPHRERVSPIPRAESGAPRHGKQLAPTR